MKVRCINDTGWEQTSKFLFMSWTKRNVPGPKVGDIVTVVGEEYESGVKYYELLEWPSNDDSFQASCFEPIEENYQSISYKEIKEKASVN